MKAKLFTCTQGAANSGGAADTIILVGPHNSGKDTFASFVKKHTDQTVFERSTVDYVKELFAYMSNVEPQSERKYRTLLSNVYDALMEYDEVPLKDVWNHMTTSVDTLFITYIRNPVHVRRFMELVRERGRVVVVVLVARDVGPIQNNNADELVFSDMSVFDAIVVNDGTLEELEQVASEFVETYL